MIQKQPIHYSICQWSILLPSSSSLMSSSSESDMCTETSLSSVAVHSKNSPKAMSYPSVANSQNKADPSLCVGTRTVTVSPWPTCPRKDTLGQHPWGHGKIWGFTFIIESPPSFLMESLNSEISLFVHIEAGGTIQQREVKKSSQCNQMNIMELTVLVLLTKVALFTTNMISLTVSHQMVFISLNLRGFI